MNTLIDEKRLLQLIRNLHILTGMRANILDAQGQDIRLFEQHPPFCRAVNACPAGHERCVACDTRSVKTYAGGGGFQFYRCHAGICEAVMPLFDQKRPLAYLIFGCFLDDSPLEGQWDNTRALVADWWPGRRCTGPFSSSSSTHRRKSRPMPRLWRPFPLISASRG